MAIYPIEFFLSFCMLNTDFMTLCTDSKLEMHDVNIHFFSEGIYVLVVLEFYINLIN